jgi:fumarate reductase flavoprotein subunit
MTCLLASLCYACTGIPYYNFENYHDGIYEGSGEGFNGLISVSFEINAGTLVYITVDHNEDAYIGGEAIEALCDHVQTTKSFNLDAISGATESSEGFISALEQALHKGP